MNWVAVDLGISTIKASVLNGNKPVRLTHSMEGYETTLLSAVSVVIDGTVVLGDYASLLGVNNPSIIVNNWLHTSDKALIAGTFLSAIKEAAIKHYSDENIGIVLLYNQKTDSGLVSIAEKVFREVKTMQVSDVIKRSISPNSDLMLIADFGESAFRVTLQDKSRCVYQNVNENLCYSSIDMLSLVDCPDLSSKSSMEIALLGQIMRRIKILANNGTKLILPSGIKVKGNSLKDNFEQKMTTFFYQCFEECTNTLNSVSKSWKEVDEIVFIGGGASSCILDAVFSKYMQSYGNIVSYNIKNKGFDAQFAATHCAIQVPELKETSGVTVEL
ncbi:MAG: hypothetical protein MJZ03_04355 [archaeon]|nr:hypothetical protein [archaeon]